MQILLELNSINLNQILQANDVPLRTHWQYHYLLSQYISSIVNNTRLANGYTRISSANLENLFPQIRVKGAKHPITGEPTGSLSPQRGYKVVREFLRELGLLEYYTHKTEQTKQVVFYKIPDKHLAKGWKLSDIVIPVTALSKMTALYNNYLGTLDGVYKQILCSLSSVSILTDEAIRYTDTALLTKQKLKPKAQNGYIKRERIMTEQIHSAWLTAISKVSRKQLHFFYDEGNTERVFNSIVSLPRELRQFLRINEHRLTEVDVSNCQPLVFCQIVKQHIPQPDSSTQHYITLCETGQLYSYLQQQFAAEGLPITPNFKIDLFARIFFSTEKRNYKYRQHFAKLFPHVSALVTKLKAKKHNDIAILLQAAEAKIMINTVCSELYQQGHTELFPLHDAIYCTAALVPDVKATIQKAFNYIGLQVAVKSKAL